MATMSKDEQQKFAQELANMTFSRASGRLRRMDNKNKMAFFRNAQSATTLQTRYALPGHGITVTLIEQMTEKATGHGSTFKPEFHLTQVIVESLE